MVGGSQEGVFRVSEKGCRPSEAHSGRGVCPRCGSVWGPPRVSYRIGDLALLLKKGNHTTQRFPVVSFPSPLSEGTLGPGPDSSVG